MTDQTPIPHSPSKRPPRPWVFPILIFYILVAGAFFRFSGLLWGEYQYLHPDERFLVWVGTDINPVKSLSEYFDTEHSTLNPHNTGHSFYVYGTLPMFITRYAVQWIFGHSGFDEMTQVGRFLSVIADLLTVILVYLVARRLYDRRVATLAAAFSAATVLQIQQSHFFTMDTFISLFSFLAFYCAVLVLTNERAWKPAETSKEITPSLQNTEYAIRHTPFVIRFLRDPLFLLSLAFGVALGMAVASKINAAPMAAVLPTAMLIGLFKLPPKQRLPRIAQALLYLLLAALVSLLVFRLFQPYAFSGPGFFGLKPNPKWVANIKELVVQSNGDVDFPPNMQWARRPVWFSFQNLTVWGLGLPLGILAWAGFLWVGWRIFDSLRKSTTEWQHHTLIWAWTAAYFTWQSLKLNPTMRYQLPIYPTLAILAGWAIIALYDLRRSRKTANEDSSSLDSQQSSAVYRPSSIRLAAILIGGAVLLATYAYAYAFAGMYKLPMTRVAATRWIYQNIPGPITLPIHAEDGIINQPLYFPYSLNIAPGVPYTENFNPKTAGTLREVILPRLRDKQGSHETRTLELSIWPVPPAAEPLATAVLVDDLTPGEDGRGKGYTLALDQPIQLDPKQTYSLRLELPGEASSAMIEGEVTISLIPNAAGSTPGSVELPLAESPTVLTANSPYSADFTAPLDGSLTRLTLPKVTNVEGTLEAVKLELVLQISNDQNEPLRSNLTATPVAGSSAYALTLDEPLPVFQDETYSLSIEMLPQGGTIAVSGTGIANEGDWDDGLPLRMDGYDGFGGIYPLELNLNMYWDDNPQKLERFVRILDEADYVVISSSRQWGSLPRMPERFPMTSLYYRNLLGCPPLMSIENCYRIAQPGAFKGKLGYELAQVFDSSPTLGSLRINDQFAEEAFTVYDHPKVFIFKKTGEYDSQKVRQILGMVDFSQIIRMPPMRYPDHPVDLMLPSERLAEQQQGGAWSDLFDPNALHNRFRPLGVLVWYLSVALLGWITYPLLRLALPGLPDGGYPLARTAGMLILSYLVWLAGSFRLPFSRLTIAIALALMALTSAYVVYLRSEALRQELRTRRGYFLLIEGLTLALFLAFLFVRWGNPDLWHPWKGGEKPMDFSYFNAVLKSTSFPPYDPWYAGGYLNYYYYGFVFMGVLVKFLGIVPSFAYNLILPTLFSMIAMGAFSIAWNLAARKQGAPGAIQDTGSSRTDPTAPAFSLRRWLADLRSSLWRSLAGLRSSPLLPALAAALGMAILGNLGTVRMIFQGYQKLVAPSGVIEGANLFQHWLWAAGGFIETLKGATLPYGLGDWYWIPSRAIPPLGDVEPITEFPFFTALYGDPHAHLFALPIALLALAALLSILLSRARWENRWACLAGFLLSGLAIGALRPTNTSDFYPYLALGLAAVAYTLFAFPSKATLRLLPFLDGWLKVPHNAYQEGQDQRNNRANLLRRLLVAVAGMLALAIPAFLLFQPYAQWNAFGYTKVDLWKGSHTPFSAYLTHWGLFLFLIVSWMLWESIDWMAKTPLSSVRKLRPLRGLVQAGLILLLGLVAVLTFALKVRIAWFILPLAAWAGILLLRPGMPNAKRGVLFLVGTGLMITLMVEVIVVVGDIGRMNTVFKFYLQAWTFFAVSAAAALGWLLPAVAEWSPGWRRAWSIALTILVAGAALYPMMATTAKIEDRISKDAPHTLDGMAFMPYSQYTDKWGTMDLNQDYEAIRWMQENVKGSPVIVEANLRDLYRWGSRYSIYTGLPGVVGWEWHQQQQRAVNPGAWVSQRIQEVDNFYNTTDLQAALDFLRKYNVGYIIVGQQERGHYPGPGLEKFEAANGAFWRDVFRTGDTVIYEVIPE